MWKEGIVVVLEFAGQRSVLGVVQMWKATRQEFLGMHVMVGQRSWYLGETSIRKETRN